MFRGKNIKSRPTNTLKMKKSNKSLPSKIVRHNNNKNNNYYKFKNKKQRKNLYKKKKKKMLC